jgi:hypothetical protein
MLDGDTPRDASVDGETVQCPAGQHACGTGCIVDLANDPANGCRLGCGDACPVPAMGMASCSAEGRCDFACTPPFRRQELTCVCAPRTCAEMVYECGAPDNGCGTPLDCGMCPAGVTCLEGRCGCGPDPREPGNDTSAGAPVIATLDDSDDPPDAVVEDATLDDGTDVDWYAYTVVDGTDFGNPVIGVTLDRIPAGESYELSAFYICDDGDDTTGCTTGTPTAELGRGCSATGTTAQSVSMETECEHLSDDESGVLLVRVRSVAGATSCGLHRVTVSVR